VWQLRLARVSTPFGLGKHITLEYIVVAFLGLAECEWAGGFDVEEEVL
jgi:hypothetical protein